MMQKVIELVFSAVVVVLWLAGIVLAKGFWSTFFSVLIAPYGWYLVVEKIMHFYGVV